MENGLYSLDDIDVWALARDFIASDIEIRCESDEEKVFVTKALLEGGARHGKWASKDILEGEHLGYHTVYSPRDNDTIEYHCSDQRHGAETITFLELIKRYTPPDDEDLELDDEVSFADVL